MSKVPLRARALDQAKPMPVFTQNEIPDLADYAACNRTISALPTGVDKEEEMELHLQQALSAQQAQSTGQSGLGGGKSGGGAKEEEAYIPIPEVTDCPEIIASLYASDFAPSKHLIKVQAALSLQPQIPDYDLDAADGAFLAQLQGSELRLTELAFETMMDRLEKNTEQSVTTMEEAKAILSEFDDDAIAAVYDYWLAKRCETKQPLIPRVKTERAGDRPTAALSPYLAFRRRAERMQTRKNRKNDEDSYEKILRLSQDLRKAVTLLEMVKRREKSKREMLSLEVEVLDKRWAMEDWNSIAYHEVLRETRPQHSFGFPTSSAQTSQDNGRPKPPRPKKSKRPKADGDRGLVSREWLQQNLDEWNRPFSVPGTPAAASLARKSRKAAPEPDGPYTFRRILGCVYYPPATLGPIKRPNPNSRLQPHPIPLAPVLPPAGASTASQGQAPGQEKRRRDHSYERRKEEPRNERLHHVFLRSFTGGLRHIGQARARRGRGGRLIFDRSVAPNSAGSSSPAWHDPDPLVSSQNAPTSDFSSASLRSSPGTTGLASSSQSASAPSTLPPIFAPLGPWPSAESSSGPSSPGPSSAPPRTLVWDASQEEPQRAGWNSVVAADPHCPPLPDDWYGEDSASILLETSDGLRRKPVSVALPPDALPDHVLELSQQKQEREQSQASQPTAQQPAKSPREDGQGPEATLSKEEAWMATAAVMELEKVMGLVRERAPLERERVGGAEGEEEEEGPQECPLPTPSPSPTHSGGEAQEKTGVAALSGVAAQASPALAISPPDSLSASATPHLPPTSNTSQEPFHSIQRPIVR